MLRPSVELHQDEHHVGGEEDEVRGRGGDDVPLVGGVGQAHAVSQPAMESVTRILSVRRLSAKAGSVRVLL